MSNVDNQRLDQRGGSYLDAVVTTPATDVGAIMEFRDGRRYRYVSTDSNLTVGEVVGQQISAKALAATAIPAFGIGTNVLTGITASSVTQNQYAGGFLVIYTGTGSGYSYRIKSNTATSGGTITVVLYDGLAVATDTTAVGALIKQKYSLVIEGTASLNPIGVACVATSASTAGVTQYFWVQTRGIGVAKRGGTLVIGNKVTTAASGAIAPGAAVTDPVVGVALASDSTNTLSLVDLALE